MKFEPMSVPLRSEKLVKLLESQNIDGLVVTGLANVRYLSGFSGSAGIVSVRSSDGQMAVTTDGRYEIQIKEELELHGVKAKVFVGKPLSQLNYLSRHLAKAKRVGLEANQIKWGSIPLFEKIFAGKELVPTSNIVEGLRKIKDVGEISRMRAAANCADLAFAKVRHKMIPGATEREIARLLDSEIRKFGAAGNSFPTILASGPNGALPHAQPSERKLEIGDLVVCDFGAVVDGYCSDMTRTVLIGDFRNKELKKIEKLVRKSQELGVQSVRAGVRTTSVDRACRVYIDNSGYGKFFNHSTGHGVGLDVHEEPYVASKMASTLKTGMVVTVEPGIYLEGLGGVRIEDTVVVTENGCQPLTLASKELVA